MKPRSWPLLGLLLALGCDGDTTAPVATPDPSPLGPDAEGGTGPSVQVWINPRSAVIQVGSSLLFTTVVRAGSGREVSSSTTWSISDVAIASVDAGGVVTARRAGQATLTATTEGAFSTARITVEEPGSSVVSDVLDWSFMVVGEGLAPIYDLWASSETDMFAVGSGMLWDCCATVLHYDGAGWSHISVPEGVIELHGVWGTSATDVFAVGSRGAVVHYDGSGWSTMRTPSGVMLEAVWGSSATDVFAVGYYPGT
ncbi:MAG TPA: Ig-like domain-containing protein, partial [Longimicrobiales bacterium]|nr:Ig-like domain-containing protein [Longimicrobiales bacterium]